MSFEDIIHNKSFDFINSLNKTISATKVSSPALQDVSLQIIIHLVSCVSALRDTLETNNNKPKTAMQTQIVSPLLNGLMATVGKVIMDNFAFEPKFAEQESFATAYCSLMRHAFRLFPDMAVKRHKASGKLLLHHAAFRAKAYIVDDSIQNILAVSPDSASVTDNSGALALHWATRNPEITASGIDLLISGYPKGVEHADEKGFMPCHWAVNQDTPNMDVLRRLLKVFPVAVRTPSRTGNLPLHYAVMRDRPNVTAVKALLAVFPDAISVRCLEGYLPVHRLVHRATVDKETLSLLIKHYPDGLTQVTEQGQTPLLVALDFPKPDYAAVAILLRACKDACQRPDLGDYYPLHMALDCAKPDYKIALEILRAYPEAAKRETKEGLTPLHLMVSTNVAMNVSSDNDSVDKDFLEALITAYPEALVQVVKDIVPLVGDGVSVAVELLESWSGEWVEQSWDVIGKARARGLESLALVLEEHFRVHFPNHHNQLNKNDSNNNKLVSSQPLKTLTSDALSPLAKPILPPRKFTLDPETNTDNNQLTPTNLKLNQQSNNNNNSNNPLLNKTDDDAIQPFSLPPEVDEDPFQHVNTNKQQKKNQPLSETSQQASPQKLQDLDEDELPQEPQLPLSQHQADAISETAVTVISSLSGTQKSKTGRPGRAPPAGPIPSSLLQAAENSSAMRMSKSQYEMLLGRVNNNNNNNNSGDSQSDHTRRSKVSKKELLLARQQRHSNNNNQGNNHRQQPPVSHSHLSTGYYSSDGGESDYKYDSGSERDSETPAIQIHTLAVTTNSSSNNNNNNNDNSSSVTPVNVVQPRHRGPPPTAQQRNNTVNSNNNNNNNHSDSERAVLSKTAPTPFVSPLVQNTSNNNPSNVPSSSTVSGKVRIFPQNNGSDMV